MEKIAAKRGLWIVAAIGGALLVANLVVSALSLASKDAPPAAEEVTPGAAALDEFAELRREHAELRADMAALARAMEEFREEVRSELEAAATPAVEPDPPPGKLVAEFDDGAQGWKVPDWGSGTVLRTRQRGMFRRGGAALALGYVYGGKPAALEGPVAPAGEVKLVHVCARTRARPVTVAVGVVEEGGARYEVRLPLLKPDEGWRLISVAPAAMGPAPGTHDPDRKLDRRKIGAVYVVDRTVAGKGGNVLAVDDVAVETEE